MRKPAFSGEQDPISSLSYASFQYFDIMQHVNLNGAKHIGPSVYHRV